MNAPLTQVRVFFTPELSAPTAYSTEREGAIGHVWLAADLDRHQQAICLRHALDTLEAPAGSGRHEGVDAV